MEHLDLDFVRAQFPAFVEPSLARFAHFENAGGSYACRHVIDALADYYRRTKVQPYYAFEPSATAGAQMDRARQRLAAWLGVETDELHVGPSTSQNTYVLAQAFRGYLRPGDEIVVTNQDHEANIGVWSRLQDEGIVVRTWQVDAQGALRPDALVAELSPRTRLVAFTHCSNIVGSVHAVRELTDLVHRSGAVAVVDGVSYCPHGLPHLPELGADIYLFSLYKVYGPHLGAMYVRRELAEALPSQAHFFKADALPGRFTPAGPDHAQVAAVNGVIDYFEAVAAHHGHARTPVAASSRRGAKAVPCSGVGLAAAAARFSCEPSARATDRLRARGRSCADGGFQRGRNAFRRKWLALWHESTSAWGREISMPIDCCARWATTPTTASCARRSSITHRATRSTA